MSLQTARPLWIVPPSILALGLLLGTFDASIASAISAQPTQFICKIEQGPYAGESLKIDLQKNTFSWTIPREEEIAIHSRTEDPFEVVVSNNKIGRGVLGLRIREAGETYLLSGGYGDYGIAGKCQDMSQ